MPQESFDLSTVQDISFNSAAMGYSKIHLNGTRIWEKYQVNTPYQVWVSSGYNNTTYSGWYPFFYRWNHQDSYILSYYSNNWSNSTANYGDGYLIGFMSYNTGGATSAELLAGIFRKPPGWDSKYQVSGTSIKFSNTTWVDTSHYETQYQMVDTWYY